MHKNKALLEKFIQYRDLKISKDELISTIGFTNCGNNELSMNKEHVIHLLEAFIKGDISEKETIEWINVVWWSDWFRCDDKDCDRIANVIGKLDTLEDIPHLRKEHLTINEAKHYIEMLRQ